MVTSERYLVYCAIVGLVLLFYVLSLKSNQMHEKRRALTREAFADFGEKLDELWGRA